MATLQPPPTYAEVVLVDEKTQKGRFNPIWLKWFVDLAEILDQAGGVTFDHNALDTLQGGSASERYHLTSAQQTLAAAILVGGLRPTTDAGAAQTVTRIFGGNGAPNNANGSNGDFYFRGDGAAGTNLYKKTAGAWAGIL